MIFVTVGTQLPFDRLIATVDAWAATRPDADVFAQIGPSPLTPRHLRHAAFVDPAECRARMAEADAVVAHAGMGTILGALELGKPLLILPRRAALGEHRNDHQVATAQRFADRRGVRVAFTESDLVGELDGLDELEAHERLGPFASERLIGALRTFLDGAPVAAPRG
ncbi:MAG: hypothetical protein QOH30_153 [Baekduia sp.]|nr:Beta,4-galactosyltransferase CpsIVG [Conexibacter sp.]MDX6713595.1 hypothetical protein [Baekduia sp.]